MLEPCPFCGGEATPVIRLGRLPFVECRTCNIEQSGHTDAEAFAAWNARTPPASQSDEALVAAMIEAWPYGSSTSVPEHYVREVVLPIIRAREAAAIAEDRRGRTFSPSALDRAREEGRREGIEECEKIAAAIAGNSADFSTGRRRGAGLVQAAIRALAEKQP